MSDSENDNGDYLSRLVDSDGDEAEEHRDKATENLEKRVQELEDAILEERFIWIIIVVALINVLLLGKSPNWSTPIIVGAFEAAALALAAERFGVERVQILFDKILSTLKRK